MLLFDEPGDHKPANRILKEAPEENSQSGSSIFILLDIRMASGIVFSINWEID
jgi:hypothetical protein